MKDKSHTHARTLKGIVHPKMKIPSSSTHPQVVPNLYACLCSTEHKGRYYQEFEKQSSSREPLTSIVFFFSYYGSHYYAPKQPGYTLSSKYLHLCSAEQRHSYRFGTIWGWVNDDIIFMFRWTIPLSVSYSLQPYIMSLIKTLWQKTSARSSGLQKARTEEQKHLCEWLETHFHPSLLPHVCQNVHFCYKLSVSNV